MLKEARARKPQFKANPLPPSTYEDRYRQLLLGEDGRQDRIRERAAKLLADAALPSRMEIARSAERQRAAAARAMSASGRTRAQSVDGKALLRARYATRPLGKVPDFDRLQNDFAEKLLRFKATNPFRRTVPREFQLGA